MNLKALIIAGFCVIIWELIAFSIYGVAVKSSLRIIIAGFIAIIAYEITNYFFNKKNNQ